MLVAADPGEGRREIPPAVMSGWWLGQRESGRCWGLHLSALRLALIGRFGLTLGDPGLTFRETGLR
jgi:hypothetical protein